MANLGLKKSLIVITGAKGVGKTTAAATYLPPSQVSSVFYHDGEHSTNRIVEQLDRLGKRFGYLNHLDERWTKDMSFDLLERISAGKLPWANTKERNSLVEFWKYLMRDIEENMAPGKFKVYVCDPVDRLEAAMQAYIEENMGTTGWNSKAFGRMWTQGFYPLYRNLFEAIYSRGVDVIIMSAHLNNPWSKGKEQTPIPGKVKVQAKPDLFRLSQLYVWLVAEPSNPDKAPAGLILKERLGVLDVEEDSWKLRGGLPRRIPHFTWEDVDMYLKNGFDMANPKPGETLSIQESQLIDDTFYSEAQMKLMLMWAKKDLAELAASNPSILSVDGEVPINVSPESLARELAETGLTVEQISEQLGKPLVLVRKWVE